jgi:hypothetical protein
LHAAVVLGLAHRHGERVVERLKPTGEGPHDEDRGEAGDEIRGGCEEYEGASKEQGQDRLGVPCAAVLGVGGDDDCGRDRADGADGGEAAEAAGTDVVDFLRNGRQERLVGEADHHNKERSKDEERDRRTAADVAKAVDEVAHGGDVVLAGAGIAGREAEGHHHGEDEADGSEEVDAAHADEGDGNEHAGERRADHARAVHAELLEDDGVADGVAPDEVGGERLARRPHEREAEPLDDAGGYEVPVLDGVHDDEDGDPERIDGDDRLGADDEVALRQAVGEDAAPGSEEELGQPEGEHDAPEGAVLIREVIGEVAAGDDLHLHAEEGEEGADPEQTELRVLQGIEGAAEVCGKAQTADSHAKVSVRLTDHAR